jgi:hypothetical protein
MDQYAARSSERPPFSGGEGNAADDVLMVDQGGRLRIDYPMEIGYEGSRLGVFADTV